GKYIDFEAKETRQKQSFPLKNFHQHQIDHMRHVLHQEGICFVILKFSYTNDVFLLEADKLIDYWLEQESDQRRSIKKHEIVTNGYEIPIGYRPRIDYLQIVDTIYFDEISL